jgi:hypothetical protein
VVDVTDRPDVDVRLVADEFFFRHVAISLGLRSRALGEN